MPADANDLTTLADLEADYNLKSGNPDETYLQRAITRASYDFYTYASRGPFDAAIGGSNEFLGVQTFTENYSGHGTKQLKLRRYPCISVTSLTVSGTAVPASPDGVQYGYTFDEDQIEIVGSLFYAGINPRGYFCDGFNNIQVVYTAGYSKIPPDLVGAIEELVMVWYERRKHLDVVNEGEAGTQTRRYNAQKYPVEVAQTFERYRRKFPWT